MAVFDSYHNKHVSYIVVTKNRAQFLDETLNRCRDLLTSEDELIVVDGASTDNTKEIVEKYRDIINKFVSEPDSNAAEAHNKGIILARGKYVRLIPDDDIVYPKAMEQAIVLLEKNPEIDLLVCGGTKDYIKKGKKSVVYLPPGINYGSRLEDAITYGASGAGHIMRRSVFAKVGLLSPTINTDIEFVMRCFARGCGVRFARIHLYYHPIYPHSVLAAQKKQHREATENLIKEYCSPFFYLSHKLFGKKRLLSKYEELPESVWDGGLS